jgi:hypothetical protein
MQGDHNAMIVRPHAGRLHWFGNGGETGTSTGEPDMAKLQAFLESHPTTAGFYK